MREEGCADYGEPAFTYQGTSHVNLFYPAYLISKNSKQNSYQLDKELKYFCFHSFVS